MTRYLFALISLLFFMACHKDGEEIITIIEYPDAPEVLITTRLVTQFVIPSPDLHPTSFSFAGQSNSLNDHPFSQQKGSGIDRDFELMEIHTAEDLNFYRVNTLHENDVNYTHIRLPTLESYDGIANTKYDFAVSGDARLSIPANSLIFSDSTTYLGAYKLYVGYINPIDYYVPAIPGYSGLTQNNAQTLVQFEKCYYIAVTTTTGTPLLFNGKASLTCTNVEGSKWSFDINKATWIVKDVETTSDFSRIKLGNSLYYAFANAATATRMTGTLNINGHITPNYPMVITYPGGQQHVYTTNEGKWVALLPAGENCTAVISPPCGDVKEIDFTTSTDEISSINFDIHLDGITNILLLGTVRDCAFKPIDLNFTVLKGPSNSLVFSEQPNLQFYIPMCEHSAFELSSVNSVDGQEGPSVVWDVVETLQINSSLACEEAKNEYLSLSVSGEQKMYWNLASLLEGDRLVISNDASDPNLKLQVFVEGLSEGTYSDNMLNIVFEDMHLGTKGYSLFCPTASNGCGFTTFTITQFPDEQGEWIRGTFEGTFWVKTFTPLTAGNRPVKGEFQVFRDF